MCFGTIWNLASSRSLTEIRAANPSLQITSGSRALPGQISGNPERCGLFGDYAKGDSMSDSDEAIRNRARQIWDEEGRPEGRYKDHWRQAQEELGTAPTADPAKKNRTKSITTLSTDQEGGSIS